MLELSQRLLAKAVAAGVPLNVAAGGCCWTPLHTAAASHSPFGRLLIEAGADVKLPQYFFLASRKH